MRGEIVKLSGRKRKPLKGAPRDVRGDDQDRLLPERFCNGLSDALGALKDASAGAARGSLEDLDDEAILAAALPDPARLELSKVREVPGEDPSQLVLEGLLVKGRRKPSVPARSLAGDPSAHVKADRAGRNKVATRARLTAGHKTSLSAGKRDLQARSGRQNGRFWVYFDYDLSSGALVVETSWLPDLPEVHTKLKPLGFVRQKDGAYRVIIPSERAGDDLAIVRLATKAVAVLLAEGVF